MVDERGKLNIFDLLGFLPEDLEDFKQYAKEAMNVLEYLGVEEFLRRAGHEDVLLNEEDFMLGVYLGPMIVDMMEDREEETR
jgi:hypothetical protein